MKAGSRVKTGKKGDLWPEHWTEKDVKNTVKGAWETRKKVQTQIDGVTGEVREMYRGVDRNGNVVEFWFNKTTGTVETAYPKGTQRLP